jgi:tetratricopeptide (TPR) repeat protein
MKKFKRNYLTFIIAASLIISSCGGLNKMKKNSNLVRYTVTPNPVEMHAGEVQVSIQTKFPEKYFNKKAVLVATPYLKYDGGETEFESTTLQGEGVQENNKVIKYAGGDVTLAGKVPYKDDMMRSDLMVRMSARIKNNLPVDIGSVKVADGIVTTPALVKNDPQAILAGDQYVRVTPESYQADIHFVINQAEVRAAELNAKDVKEFENSLKTVSQAERRDMKGVRVSSYASPDGDLEKINRPLSEKRGTSAERYLQNVFKKAKLTQAQQKEFLSIVNTPEDWEGFEKLMRESNIQDKELILRVLSMYSDPAVREREIKNISATFKEVADKILPQLRRSVMTLNVDVTGYSDEELLDLARNDANSLKNEEILRAASIMTSNEDKLAAYEVAAKNFPQDFRGRNGVGYVYMQMGDYAKAQKAFEDARTIADNSVVKNNLGAAILAQGDIAKAEELLTSAVGAGEQVNYNLGIIKIKQGDYKAALNYFGNKSSYNTALAQLLNGDADKALTTLNQVKDEDAQVAYLKAVASAKGGNEQGVFNNLRTAVGKDAKWKNYAKKDVTFMKYESNETFTSIVQ